MRIPTLLLIGAVVGAPVAAQAQDFLGAIARQAAASVAQNLANRAAQGATNAVTNAVTRPADPAQPGATAAAPAAPTRPEIRQHGIVQPWTPEGDLIFLTPSRRRPALDGKPYWENSAFCAAMSRTADIQVEKRRQEWAAEGKTFPEEYARESLDGIERQVAYQRRFALLRMDRDRPGQDNGASFDARVVELEAELRTRDWTPRTSWTDLSEQCGSYQTINGNFLMMMANGRSK